jgi:two-component system, chemotaxis family, sensor kinase CheA
VDLQKYRTLFVDEATDHLAEMAGAIVALQTDGESHAEAVDTLFRMTHSIKGMAASLDYTSVSTLAHRLEDWLEPWRKKGAFPEAALPLVSEVVRAMEAMVAVVEKTGDAPPPRDDLIARLAEPTDALALPAEGERPASKKDRKYRRRRFRAPFACAPR